MLTAKLTTVNLTSADSPFVVKANAGITQFNLVCRSATPITYCGSGSIAGKMSEPIQLLQNDTFSYNQGVPLEDWTIVLPAGATAELTAIN